MREYYGRLFGEVKRDLVRFWKAQIAVSLVAGIAFALVNGWQGTIRSTLTDVNIWKYSLSVTFIYMLILAARGAFAIVEVPVKLDQQRQAELAISDQRRINELADLNRGIASERGVWANGAVDTNADLADCREQLARKHPHDEAKEAHVRASLVKLNEEDIKALGWLLDNGETHEIDFPKRDIPTFHVAMGKASLQISPKLVVFRQGTDLARRMAGADIWYKINPNYEEALKNVLHPPSRQITLRSNP
jgi:hypothetical protein